MQTTLLIMAAGIGSRFGGGIKQLEPVDEQGHIIMDYSIHDAIEAGFNKVIFIIRKDIENEFKDVIGNRIEAVCKAHSVTVEYVFQDINDIPGELPEGRTKPWGTGQAVLAAKDVLTTPFVVINADDYYGKEAYREAFEYLTKKSPTDIMQICMVSFVLKNTLSDNGTVTRGICRVSENGMLTDIRETHDIARTEQGAGVLTDGRIVKELDADATVSMNMWGMTSEFFEVLKSRFDSFLNKTEAEDLKAEYLLPTLIGELLSEHQLEVRVLKSHDQWFGVTYQEDKATVTEAIQRLISRGIYPSRLFK